MKKVFLTICCQGGLGNQLFQFIIGYILAKKNKITLRINIDRFNSYDKQFELDKFPEIYKLNIPKIKKNKFCKILKISGIYKIINFFFLLDKQEFEKSPFIFNRDLLKKKIVKNVSIVGFFQSEKYFIHYKKIVLKLLRFSKIKDKLHQKYLNLINNKNSVAIHIRRGDYKRS
jgi:hypothetical protein